MEFAAIKEVDEKVAAVNNDLQQFKMDMPILGLEESKITKAIKKKGVHCLGGKESNAYNDRSGHCVENYTVTCIMNCIDSLGFPLIKRLRGINATLRYRL